MASAKPSTIAPMSELDALVGAMGPRGKGVVAIASGVKTPAELEPMAARYGRPFFQGTGMAMYNEQEPARALGIFDACAAALRRGNGLYIQIPCQPLSFDFTMANAYPFYSHSAFDPIKAFTPEQLVEARVAAMKQNGGILRGAGALTPGASQAGSTSISMVR